MAHVTYNGLPSLEALIDEVKLGSKYAEYFDHFHTFNAVESSNQSWLVDNATAGTATLVASTAGASGVLELDSASSTADQGVQIQQAVASFVPQPGKRTIFETKVKITDTPSGVQFFAGLGELDTSFFSSGLVSAANYIGFVMDAESINANPGELFFNSEKATVRGFIAHFTERIAGIDSATLVDGTWYRLGFMIERDGTCRAYVNGVLARGREGGPWGASTGYHKELPAIYTPVVALSPTFACLSEGTVDPITYVDYVHVIQEL